MSSASSPDPRRTSHRQDSTGGPRLAGAISGFAPQQLSRGGGVRDRITPLRFANHGVLGGLAVQDSRLEARRRIRANRPGSAAAWARVLTAILIGFGPVLSPGAAAGDAPDRAILRLFPGPEETRPWAPDGPAQIAEGQELFALIDGGAELFLRHGFERAAVQNYTLGRDQHIQVEIYLMQSMDGATEVFARKTGPGEMPLALGDAGAKGEYYIVFRRGRFLVTVATGDATTDAKATMLQIARAIDSRIPARSP